MSLKKVEAYTSKQNVNTLEIVNGTSPEIDYLHIVGIDGLDPVTASISSTELPSADLSIISGEEIPPRNIVLTLSPDPDWSTWTPEKLRRLVYAYFTPKSIVKLVFYTEIFTGEEDEKPPVEIYGEVESCSYNQFSPDPQYQISIICSDPYFTATIASIVTGTVIALDNWPPSEPITIDGDVPIGCQVKLVDGYESGGLYIQSGDPSISSFHLIVDTNPSPNTFFMDSRPLHKKVRTFDELGVVTNLLRKLQPGYEAVWPVLEPGENLFAVMGEDNVGDSWELTYFEKYGGL